MNWRMLVMVSAAMNVLLAALIVHQRREPAGAGADGNPAGVLVRTNIITRTITNILDSGAVSDPGDLVWPTWKQIAGTGWVEYRDNLLAYSCPPATLRKIITTELKREHFDERNRATEAVSRMFWDLIATHELKEEIEEFEEAGRTLKELARTYQALENELLNGIPQLPSAVPLSGHSHYGHLSAGSQDQLMRLEARFEEERNAIESNPDYRDKRNILIPEGLVALQELDKELRTARRALMSEEEFLEYRLKTSDASNWASGLHGFEPTDEEIRQVAEWHLALDDHYPQPRRGDPEAREKNAGRRAAQQELEGDLQELFGPERHAVYERSRDGSYQEFYDLTEVFGLSENVAINAWEMRQSAIETAENVRKNDQLTAVEKRDALRAVQQETRDSLRGILTDEYLQAYEHKTGDWIDGLSRIRN